MSIDDHAADIRDEFSFFDDWEDRYAHIIDLGKANPPLKDHERNEITRVRGCASQVWLVSEVNENATLTIRAQSDAMIVSGLIALLVRLYSGAMPKDILAFDINSFLAEIGVTGALTAQRSNGLASMVERIRADANRALG
ncbi:MAG: SufE family protein [Pseudomonadota bacterium]